MESGQSQKQPESRSMTNKVRNLSSLVVLLKPDIDELIQNKEWREIKDLIVSWEAPDIADLLRELPTSEMLILFRMLPQSLQSDVLAELEAEDQELIIRGLTDEQAKAVIAELTPDDRTELFEELTPSLTRKLISLLPAEERKEALQLLGYPENSVGRIMTPDYVALNHYWSVAQAIEHIRKVGIDAETINMVYVVDDEWHLLDDIPLRRLVLAAPDQSIESLMDNSFVSINVHADQEEAIKPMKRYDLVALPVTDNDGHLLGIVTIDDIVDVIEEEQTEDLTKIAAIDTGHVSLDFITNIKEIPLSKLFRSRVTWLIALLLMDLITGGIIQGFEETIAKYVVLVTFLPVLVDTAGNAGAQSATLVIRAMALGLVSIRDWLLLFGRELLVALGLGLAMGLGISVMGIVRGGSLQVAFVVVVSMIINVVIGSLIGVLLPFIFTKFKKDPAAASTPLITSLADIIGTGIYLCVAWFVLG